MIIIFVEFYHEAVLFTFDHLICSLRAACTVRHALLDLTAGATHPVHICQIPQGGNQAMN